MYLGLLFFYTVPYWLFWDHHISQLQVCSSFKSVIMAVVVGPGRNNWPAGSDNHTDWHRPTFVCDPADQTAAIILITLGSLGIGANLALMVVILAKTPLRR